MPRPGEAQRVRKLIALGIFMIGVALTVAYMPLRRCENVGDNGEITSTTICVSIGYKTWASWPQKTKGGNWIIAIDHSKVAVKWLILLLLACIIGMDYGWLIGEKK